MLVNIQHDWPLQLASATLHINEQKLCCWPAGILKIDQTFKMSINDPSTSGRPVQKRRQLFDVTDVLSMLDEEYDSGSDLDLVDFGGSGDESSADSENEGLPLSALTQLPASPTPRVASVAAETVSASAARPVLQTVTAGKRAVATSSAVRSKKGNTKQSMTWIPVDNLAADKPVNISNFTGVGGPTYNMPGDAPPVNYFDRFFLGDDDTQQSLWDFLVLETNKYQQR